MTDILNHEERDLLSLLCNGHWIHMRHYDLAVFMQLEKRGLAKLSLLGQPYPTPTGYAVLSDEGGLCRCA